MSLHSVEQLAVMVDEWRSNQGELEYVEFKENNADAQEIGEYISALSNAAALRTQPFGYLVWGVRDADHEVVGTTFTPVMKAKGNEDLIPWLTRMMKPQVHFEFEEFTHPSGNRVVVLSIEAAHHEPIRFANEAYIRSDSYKKKLVDLPDHARRLWATFDQTPFERAVARDRLAEETAMRLIDYEAYFDLTHQPMPDSREAQLDALAGDDLLRAGPGGTWQVTNLGAILFARDINTFPTVARKASRVVSYDGVDKAAPAREQLGGYGYALGFRGLIQYISERVPSHEVFDGGVRTRVSAFPEKAVRELVANALIHQDFTLSGTGPMIEIYSDRIEVTNSGAPLVKPERLIDAAPRSRNEALASLMRRMGICEERGSGWDQIAALVETSDLPAPLVEAEDDFMRVTLFAHRSFKDLTSEEKVRAVYYHSCLQFVRRQRTTNSSLRERFRVSDSNKAAVSRLIRDALHAGVIKPYDASVGAKAMSYVPYWAAK